MILLSASKISKNFGITEILKDISFSVNTGEKIGILGVNGAGKSTLFNILCEELEPDSGNIYKSAGLKICHVKQQIECHSDKTPYETVLESFEHILNIENQLNLLEKELQHNQSDELIQRHHNLNQKYIDEGGLTYKSMITSALNGLGIENEIFHIPMSSLSGGQRTKVALAKILLQKSDILLLDEPTNHLDIKAITWLEGFLSSYSGAILLVTHDRYFLDSVTNKIFEIEHHKIREYNGNYSSYVKQKDEIRKAELKDYNLKAKEIKRLEGIIAQQKQWNREKNIKTAESKQKVIDRIEETMVKPEKTLDTLAFRLNLAEECANDVLTGENLSKGFGDNLLFANVNIDIKKGEKVFLLGENGSGKTTLFNIIMGKLTPDTGKLKIGPRVKISYYDQTQSTLNLNNTIFDEISDTYPAIDNTQIRSALAVFLFKGEDVFKEISTLSGGERARVSLCKLMLSKANFLFLDEPTNHLDIPSKEALENALLSYNGTLFIISHDRYFINKLASKIYEISKDGEKCVNGSYDYYLSFMKRQAEMTPTEIKPVKGLDFKQQKELESAKRKLRTRISKLEELIAEKEAEKEEIENKISLPENTSNFTLLSELTTKLEALENEIFEAMEEWENTQKELEEKESL